jgi:hypothetical protein
VKTDASTRIPPRPVRRGVAGIAGLLLLALGGSAIDAAPFTACFDPLQDELESRNAAPAGTFTLAQDKLIDKSILALARESTGLVQDLKTLIKVFKLLGKAFPGDAEITAWRWRCATIGMS